MSLVKVGLFGGNGGDYHDVVALPQRITSITIRSGHAIDAIAFAYIDAHGNHCTTGLWGGGGGSPTQIQLGPHDYVREVSGTHGPFGPAANVITSLNIITNLTSFSFGRARGTNFRIPVENNGRIVGFYGRSGWYLDAIGVYIRA